MDQWRQPGGKLRELGAESLSDSELLAILISTGIRGRSASQIAEDTLRHFGSLRQIANVPLEQLLAIKGLSDVKFIRIAAAFEIARRLAKEPARDEEKQTP